jgi:hypothetical protein
LDGTIRQMHLPNGVSGGVSDIASPLTKHDDALDIVKSWRAWGNYRPNATPEASRGSKDRAVGAAPETVIGAWLLVDSFLFAPALALLLVLAGRRRRSFATDDWGTLVKYRATLAAVICFTATMWAVGELVLIRSTHDIASPTGGRYFILQ